MTDKKNLWIIDDDSSIRWVMERAFEKSQFKVRLFDSANTALLALSTEQPDVIISDIKMPDTSGLSFLKQVQLQYPQIPVIIMTAHADLKNAVSAYSGGAFEYIPKPFDLNEIVLLATRAAQQKSQPGDIDKSALIDSGLVGKSSAMQSVFKMIGRLSQSSLSVLINGETGTGKELVARALHKHSPRAEKPFIALNMAAIPRELLESELFGHERGAFTGAQTSRKGRFEQAEGGTLFFDEIGDMPLELQTRLLRILAEGEYYRVGGNAPVISNVRIIAATHQNLIKLVSEKRFREDLLHRLNVIHINVPALRDRPDDIPVLTNYFIQQFAKELSIQPKQLHQDIYEWLMQQYWSGNVRELQNICRRLCVLIPTHYIQLKDLPADFISSTQQKNSPQLSLSWQEALHDWAMNKIMQSEDNIMQAATNELEKILIRCALDKTGGHKSEAAKLLGWGRNTLTRKMQELNL